MGLDPLGVAGFLDGRATEDEPLTWMAYSLSCPEFFPLEISNIVCSGVITLKPTVLRCANRLLGAAVVRALGVSSPRFKLL